MYFEDCRTVHYIPEKYRTDAVCGNYCLVVLKKAHACVTRFIGHATQNAELEIPKHGAIISGIRFRNASNVKNVKLILRTDANVLVSNQIVPYEDDIKFYNDMIRIKIGDKICINSFPSTYYNAKLSCELDGSADVYIDYVYLNETLRNSITSQSGLFTIIDKCYMYFYDMICSQNETDEKSSPAF